MGVAQYHWAAGLTWLELHIRGFEAFGGVPHTMVPDNLKAAVIRAAFGTTGDTALNRSYRELARYYGFKIDPTPPYAPRKKGRSVKRFEQVPGDLVPMERADAY